MEIHTHAVGGGPALRLAGQLEVPDNPQGKELPKQRRSRAEAHEGP